MGKARKHKTHGVAARAAADCATAIATTQDSQPPSHGGANDGTGATPQMDVKAGVLDGLASLNTLTRESSCAAIASLFEKIDSPEAGTDSWSAAQRLIAGGLVKKLLPRMVDRAPGVKLQATGAMRNISAVRDPRLCELLVHDDCMTPVLTLLDRMSTPPPAATAAGAAAGAGHGGGSDGAAAADKTGSTNPGVMAPEQEVVVMAQLVATLCNLLAAVDVAVGRFTSQGGLQVVMRLLLAGGCRGSPEVFGGALQALHVATDSNVDLACRLAALPGAVDQISSLVRGADVPYVKVSMAMRVQAAGVLVNVAGLSSNAAQTVEGQTHLSNLVLPLLLEQMCYNPAVLQQACVALAAAAAADAAAAAKPGAEPDSMDVDTNGSAAVSGEGGVSGVQGAVEARVAAGVAAVVPMDMATGGAVIVERPPQEVTGVASEVNGKAEPEAQDEGGADAGGCTDDEVVTAPDQPDMDAKLRWEWKLGVAEPLKLTAEVMANLCSLAAGETGEGDEDEEEWGSDDEDAMEQAASGGAGQQQQDSKAGGGSAPAVLLDAMAEGSALPRTLATLQALLSPTPRDQDQGAGGAAAAGAVGGGAGVSPPPAAEGVNATNRLPLPGGSAGDLADLRATVALCAANLVQNLPARALGENPYGLWTDLCGLCEAAVQRAPSCVETLTGVMWGLARRAGPAVAAGIRASSTAPVASGGAEGFVTDPLHMLLRLCDPEVTRAFEARVNAVGMLGALGSAVAVAGAGNAPSASQGDGAELRLGRALVQVMEDPHVLVQAEALNAVMDVYGDDGLDAAFRASGAPEALAAAVPAFRRKVKQEGKVLGRDALCHLKETALNASRFVKYKQAAATGGRGR